MQVFTVKVQHPDQGEIERKVAADSQKDAEAMLESTGFTVISDKTAPEPKPRSGRAAKKDG